MFRPTASNTRLDAAIVNAEIGGFGAASFSPAARKRTSAKTIRAQAAAIFNYSHSILIKQNGSGFFPYFN
jgi:hypothetical protein